MRIRDRTDIEPIARHDDIDAKDDMWVFGYASLMWNPGFPFKEKKLARIFGYHRALCVRSWVHRGTREIPGLVFGLDLGGSCTGLAFRISRENEDKVMDYLGTRELVSGVYVPQTVNIHIAGWSKRGLTFVVRREHSQYVNGLPVELEAEIIRTARGPSGANIDYVLNTLHELERVGVRNSRMTTLKSLLEHSHGERCRT